MHVIGYIMIIIGILFTYIGLYGIYRSKNFYSRVLSSADIDTMGLITVLLGVVFISGYSRFTLKVLLILAVLLIINPTVTSNIVSSAYFSGYRLKQEGEEQNDE